MVGEEERDSVSPPTRRHRAPRVVLETNVDDLNPELYGYVLERLFAAGAQDAWLTPIVMKKGRPAVMISVLVSPSRQEAVRQVLFRETGTLGIRASVVDKQTLERDWVEVATQHGSVRVKIGRLEGNAVTVAPEFEDCVKVAREAGVPGSRRVRGSDAPGARGDRRVKLILLVIAAALIVGLLTGGSFRYFPSIPLGWWSLAIGGIVLQFLPLSGDAGFWALVASFVLLLAFALLNLRAPGFILIFCGLLLNAIVIFANHGMPVAREALIRSGQGSTLTDLRESGGSKHHLADDDTVLLVLGDSIVIPQPIGVAVSVGDLCVYLGVAWCFVASIHPRERGTARI